MQPLSGIRSRGEPFVWLASLGLLTALVIILGLAAVLLWKGTRLFWPADILVLELRDDPEHLFPERVAGIPRATSDVIGDPDEQVLQTGNQETYGLPFHRLEQARVLGREKPKDIAFLQTRNQGDLIGFPRLLISEDGRQVAVSETDFRQQLSETVGRSLERWNRIQKLETFQLAAINRKLARLSVNERSLLGRENSPQVRRAIENNARKMEVLQEDHDRLVERIRSLRTTLNEGELSYTLATGEALEVRLGDLIGIHFPNQMGPLEKSAAFVERLWRFVMSNPREANLAGGVLPAIFGTVVLTLLMSVFVTPMGVIAALYLQEYARSGWMVRLVRIGVNNLAGVPSIVYGVFGLGFFVYFLGGSIDSLFFSDRLPTPTYGTGGILWASLTLALMIVPVVIVATEEALLNVPDGAREASYACGASRWQTIRRVVLPGAAPGILTGLILAMARAAGEVAPLMLLGVVKLAASLPVSAQPPFLHLESKFMHLGFHIFDLAFQSPKLEAALPIVFATCLILIGLIVTLNLLASLLRGHFQRRLHTGRF